MGVYEVEHNGKTYEVDAPDLKSAMAALGQMGGGKRRASPEVIRDADLAERTGAGGFNTRFADTLSFGAFNPLAAGVTAAGKTAYKAATGAETDIAGDYRHERDVQDEVLRRAREQSGIGGTAAEIGLSLPFMAGSAAASGVANAPGLIRQGIEASKAGAKYGAIYGANSARGGVDEHLENALSHGLTGAVLGPALHYGIGAASRVPGAVSDAIRWATGRTAPAVTENAGRLSEFANAGVREFGPEVGGGVSRFAGRGLANSIAGAPLRSAAQETIGDITSGARNALARHTEGQPVNDLGANLQNALRTNLSEHSRSSNEINRMTSPELEGITGRMGEAGFAPPPPIVDPIPPRPVTPVRPAEIDPNGVPYDIVQPRPVSRGTVQPTYPKAEDIPAPPHLVQQAEAAQREFAAASAEAQASLQRYDEAVARTGAKPDEVAQWLSTPAGKRRFGPEVAAAHDAALAAEKAADEAKRRLTFHQRSVELEKDKAWRESVRTAHARAEADVESSYIRDRSTATREAQAATQAAREKAIRDAQMKAEADAAAETARLRAQAIADAEAATEQARHRATADYNATAPRAGFTPGQSRESYPTEFAAAYEQAARVTPEYRQNPMGGPTAEGRAAKTATRDVVDSLADEAHRRLHLNGKPFDEAGSVTPEFEAYLRNRLGNEIGHRIAELSRTRPGHDALTPRGLKELRTEIRQAAERAESPPYPEMPRTAEAAALRRLHGALTDDMGNFARSSGGPAPRFTTETMAGEHVGRNSTKIGNMPPSDMTVYVKPEHLEMLTGTRVPNDVKGALPATRSYEVQQGEGQTGAIMIRRNDTGEIDRATRVPFSARPEVGLRPLQMWRDSNGIHYGSPITTRAQSPGEHGAAITAAVDRAYAEHLNEIRRPLGQVFGERVEPIKAMDRLVKAAETGDLSLLRPFMRVMSEKGNPTRAASAIVTHATNGARTMREFQEGFASISREARDVLFASPEGRALRTQLESLEGLATRMAPYERAIAKAGDEGLRIGHVPVGVMMFFHFIPSITAYAGASGMARFMASPRYVRWLTDLPQMRSPSQINRHVSRLGVMLDRDEDAPGPIRSAAKNAARAAIKGLAPAARADDATGGAASEVDKLDQQLERIAGGISQRAQDTKFARDNSIPSPTANPYAGRGFEDYLADRNSRNEFNQVYDRFLDAKVRASRDRPPGMMRLGGSVQSGDETQPQQPANDPQTPGQSPPDPVDIVGKAAEKKGINLQRARPQEVIDAAWEASPTDEIANAIEIIAKQHNLLLPWN